MSTKSQTQQRKQRRLAPFVLLETTWVLSSVASGMTYIVVPWLLLQLTGSALLAGVAIALKGIVAFFVYPIAGTFVDRVGRRRVAIFSDALGIVALALFPLLALTPIGANLWVVFIVMMLTAFLEPPGFAARKALVVNTAEVGNIPLERANGIHEGLRGIGWMAGPALGSIAIASVGAANSFWVMSGMLVLSLIAVSSIRVSHTVQQQSDLDTDRSSFWRETVEGFQALGRDKALLILLLFWTALDMVYLPSEEIVLPYYFNERNDPVGLGIVISSMVLGGVVGSLLFEVVAKRFSRPAIVRFSIIASCGVLLLMGFFPPTLLMAIIGFTIGLVWGPMMPLLSLLVQRRFPSHMQGRVFGVQLALFSVAPPLAMPVVGWLVEQYGAQPVYMTLQIVLFIGALGVVFLPSINDLSRDTEPV